MKTPYTVELLSADTNLFMPAFMISSKDMEVGGEHAWSVRSFTLRGGLQEGVDVVEINNGKLSFAVLPTRGMGIWKGQCGDVRLGWDSPVKDPVHPSFIHPEERGGLGWLRGFNEWIVRCGLSSMGAPGKDVVIDNNGNESEVFLPLHGNIANTPARRVTLEISESGIVLKGEVDETMLFGPALRLNTEIRTDFGSGALTIVDTVTNIGKNPTEHELLYHINYGDPLLEAGAKLELPFKEVAPRDPRAAEGVDAIESFASPVDGFVEQAYWYNLVGKRGSRQTLAMLRNAKGNRASVLRFSLKDFPCFTLWKNTAAKEDGYVIGMEPSTSYPNARRFERESGRVLTLKGGESRSTSLTVETLTSRKAVSTAADEIKALQKTVKPTRHPEPIAKYSDI
jgi:hypothetical protein